jgi:thymidylate kinase
MKTIFVNLYGGPGTGKSTMAARLFADLKDDGIDAELVREYAKDICWEESFTKLKNQNYLFSKQHNRQFILDNKLQVVVTDSPLLLSLVYDEGNSKTLGKHVLNEYNKFNNINIFLRRIKAYNPNGRTQNFDDAKRLDYVIKNCLIVNNVEFKEFDAVRSSTDDIIKLIKSKL